MKKGNEFWQLDGQALEVTHLDKVFWPEDKLTKGDMLNYYRNIAQLMLPYMKERPVTMHIFPNGIHGFSYYRRDLPQNAPSWLRYVDYQTEVDSHTIQLPLVDNPAGLIWFANQGGIEFHLWSSHIPDLTEPDMVIFDLDPGESANFTDVMQAALRLRDTLYGMGLQGYPKTSGQTGMHVYLPLAPGYTFDAVRTWVKKLTADLAANYPDLIAVAHGATHRGSRVTIDYAQNSIGHNTAAPYTLRARKGAPASTPLTWDEVEDGHIVPSQFTLRTIPDRVAQLGDIFLPVLSGKQSLPALSIKPKPH